MNKKIAIDTGKSTTKIVAESKGNTSIHLSFISAIQESTDYTDDNTNHILEYEGRTYLAQIITILNTALFTVKTYYQLENTLL